MESISSIAFYSIIKGRNCFCCLCFKTVADSVVHMEDEIFIKLKDKNRVNVVVGDLLLEVLGEELCRQLSAFDAICNSCMSSAIDCFKFIRKCKNNIQNLCKVIDNFSMGLKDASKGILEEHRAAYVAIDTKRCIWSKYYSKINFHSRPKAFEKFITMEKQQKLLESKKRASVNKRVLRISLIRIEDDVHIQLNKHKQTEAKKVSSKNITSDSKNLYEPKPKMFNFNNDNSKKKCPEMSQYVCINKIDDKVNHMCSINPYSNIVRSTSDENSEKAFKTPQYVCVNDEVDKINGICRLITVPNILRNNNKKRKNLRQFPGGMSSNIINGINDKDKAIHLPSETKRKPLLDQTSQSSIQHADRSQINFDCLESPFNLSDVEMKSEEYDDTAQCQFCGVMCDNWFEFTSHLKTHDRLMIIESIIKF